MPAIDGAAMAAKGEREKQMAALTSVLAAIFLTSMKLVVGLLTMSLGILSEAAHSALDLVAAAVTFFAVRVSGRPPDEVHSYGHGKVENLSALFETLLLLVTCVWIIYEAIQRLFFKEVAVEASIWAFVIMLISIVTDFSRSRVLARAARKYDSQALEADALHFSTDIWSSSVVIAGLLLVRVADWLQLPWLAKADAAAALGVAGIVIYVSIQLGKRTVAGLLDAVPPGLLDDVGRAVKVAGVLSVDRVRVRRSGPKAFADVTLAVSRDTTFEEADEIATAAEAAAQAVLPRADIVVHVEPVQAADEGVVSTVRVLAARHGLGVHGVRVYDVMGNHSVDLHLEVENQLSLDQAHALATEFEKDLRQALPFVARTPPHIAPAGEMPLGRPASPADAAQVTAALQQLPRELGVDFSPHDVRVNRLSSHLFVTFHCRVPANTPIIDAHALTERVEQALRSRVPSLARVTIHMEPRGAENER